ncbi:MAG TPA: hypothetical protein VHW44_30895 [Pseudonocardiaceae bacterium]|nr:hypothetical protein [Pseudonocardiaceae bacterium]
MDQRSTGRSRWVLLLILVALFLIAPPGIAPPGIATQPATFSTTCRGLPGDGCLEVRITPVAADPQAPPSAIRELQANLCNSGLAACYQHNRSPTEAAALIARYQPTVVTLNEVCSADIIGTPAAIPSAMARVARQHDDPTVFALFTPAVNRYTRLPYRCTDGDLYGIGIVGRGPAPTGAPQHYVYQRQLVRSDEERAAICLQDNGYDLCTTHLESDDNAVADAQCHELLNPTGHVSAFRRSAGEVPTVIGGDFNLATSGMPDIQDCVPAGWSRSDDGGVQHVLATGLAVTSTRTVHMRYTDHPALIVDLTRSGPVHQPSG